MSGNLPNRQLIQGSERTVHRNVVQDQSIIGLAYKAGVLYGSTSVWGGLGIEPSETEARIFVWNVARGEKIAEFVPEIPGMEANPIHRERFSLSIPIPIRW